MWSVRDLTIGLVQILFLLILVSGCTISEYLPTDYPGEPKKEMLSCPPCESLDPCVEATCSKDTGYRCIYRELDNVTSPNCFGYDEDCNYSICRKGACIKETDRVCLELKKSDEKNVSEFQYLLKEFERKTPSELYDTINVTELQHLCKISANEYEVAVNEEVEVELYHRELDNQNLRIQCMPRDVKECNLHENKCRVFCSFPVEGTYVVNTLPGRPECTPIVIRVSNEVKKSCAVFASPNNKKGPFTSNITILFYRLAPDAINFSCDGVNFKEIRGMGNAFTAACDYFPINEVIVANVSASYRDVNCSTLIYAEPPLDIQPPTVFISSPNEGQRFTHYAIINVSAYDNVGIEKIDLYVDGLLSQTVMADKLVYTFDMTQHEENSKHIVFARAYDRAGNVRSSRVVTFYKDYLDSVCTVSADTKYKFKPATYNFNITFYKRPSSLSTLIVKTDADANKYSYYLMKSGVSSFEYEATYTKAGEYTFLVTDPSDSFRCVYKAVVLDTKDLNPPQISIIGLPDSRVLDVTRNYTFSVITSDDVGVSRIFVFLDDELLCNAIDSNNVACSLDLSKIKLGKHLITVEAYDPFENKGYLELELFVESPIRCRFMPGTIKMAVGTSKTLGFECYNEYGIISCPNNTITYSDINVFGVIRERALEFGGKEYVYFLTVPKELKQGNYFVYAYDKATQMQCHLYLQLIDDSLFRCSIEPEKTMVLDNQNIKVLVNYYNFTERDRITLFCKPGDMQSCIGIGNGSCEFMCNYVESGNYTLVAFTPYQKCDYASISVVRADFIAPAVTLVTPKEGVNIGGSVMVKAISADNDRIAYMQLYFDERLLAIVEKDEITYMLDTTNEKNGWHDITAVAFDRYGNRGFSKIRVYIYN